MAGNGQATKTRQDSQDKGSTTETRQDRTINTYTIKTPSIHPNPPPQTTRQDDIKKTRTKASTIAVDQRETPHECGVSECSSDTFDMFVKFCFEARDGRTRLYSLSHTVQKSNDGKV